MHIFDGKWFQFWSFFMSFWIMIVIYIYKMQAFEHTVVCLNLFKVAQNVTKCHQITNTYHI